MTEYVFQCDYCGEYVPTSKAVEYVVPQRPLDDGRVLAIIGTYCGTYCGSKDTTWRAAG